MDSEVFSQYIDEVEILTINSSSFNEEEIVNIVGVDSLHVPENIDENV